MRQRMLECLLREPYWESDYIMNKIAEYTTQTEVLEKIVELYSEILRITSQIDFANDEYERIVKLREKLFDEISALQKKRDSLPSGASVQKLAEYERKVQTLIMSIIADTSPILEKSINMRDAIKEELSKVSAATKAAKCYAANK